MVPFYGWGSTASRLEPLRGGSLLFTTKFSEIPGTHYQPQKDERLSWPWSHPVVLNTGPLDWESSALTTRPLLQYYPQTLLEEWNYESKKIKMENLIDDDLEKSLSDESDNDSDDETESDNEKDNDESNE